MRRAILSFLGGVCALAITIMATTPAGDAAKHFLSYYQLLPALPSGLKPIATAISVMAASILFPLAIITVAKKPKPVNAEEANRKRKQDHLDELSELKEPMAALRIEMEKDRTGATSFDTYKQRTERLRGQVAVKIKGVSGKADANNYLTCGNLNRRLTNVPHQLYIDILIRDLDYLDKFIEKHTS
jgi:hypothetical protein